MDTLKKIGKYKYAQRHCLGQGSFGKVFEGTDQSGRKVAIKKIQQSMIASDNYLRQSLNTQIAIMKKLKHRNIVELIDTVITANSIYLVLQYCKDGDLKRYARNKKFTQQQALEILKQLLQGFYLMHKEGVIHRDLKPANVLVHEGIFKICDFGFAKYFGQMNRMARTCVGTPIYMSPQVLKQKPYTSKSDVWSLGVMYYQLLFEKVPYIGKSEDQIFRVISKGKLLIPKCTQQSYMFLKNTLVIDQAQRWDWNKVFQHFGVRDKNQKPGFYQNFVNLIKGNSGTQDNVNIDKKLGYNNNINNINNNYQNNNNYSFQKRQQRVNSFKDNNNRLGYNNNNNYYGINQTQSPQKDDYIIPKGRHNKMARNIFALDEPVAVIQQPYVPKLIQTPKNEAIIISNNNNNNNNFIPINNAISTQRIYTLQQTQKLRWVYGITTKFLIQQPLYMMKIHSFQLFLHSLVSYTLKQYEKQTTSNNIKQFTRIKKLILEQQKKTLRQLLYEMKNFQPCTDIRSIASIIELEGKGIISNEDQANLRELMSFII